MSARPSSPLVRIAEGWRQRDLAANVVAQLASRMFDRHAGGPVPEHDLHVLGLAVERWREACDEIQLAEFVARRLGELEP